MIERTNERTSFTWFALTICVLIALTFVVSSAGCYTIKSLGELKSPKVYGGVRRHIREQQHIHDEHQRLEFEERSGPKLVLMILDMPFCGIFDTLFLVFTPFMSYDPSGRGEDEFEELDEERDYEWQEWR